MAPPMSSTGNGIFESRKSSRESWWGVGVLITYHVLASIVNSTCCKVWKKTVQSFYSLTLRLLIFSLLPSFHTSHSNHLEVPLSRCREDDHLPPTPNTLIWATPPTRPVAWSPSWSAGVGPWFPEVCSQLITLRYLSSCKPDHSTYVSKDSEAPYITPHITWRFFA